MSATKQLTVATRRSPLALAQARLVVNHLSSRFPDTEFALLEMVKLNLIKIAQHMPSGIIRIFYV